MDILKKIGISYKANYLKQGNQIERLNVSKTLKVENTELMLRTDGKDSNTDNILKNYKGNVIFNLPPINPDLSNLDLVNKLIKNMDKEKIKLLTINASNLSLDLFEWSTLEEQKKYFLNIVTAISTLASNKIPIAIENLNIKDEDAMFGSNLSEIADIIAYSKKLLVKDFGIKEEEAEKYIGVCLNVDNINDELDNYFEVFNSHIRCIKIRDINNKNEVLDKIKEKNIDVPILLETKSDLEDVKMEYENFKNIMYNYFGITIEKEKVKKNADDKGFSNIIICTMMVLTIVIVVLMFIVKLR